MRVSKWMIATLVMSPVAVAGLAASALADSGGSAPVISINGNYPLFAGQILNINAAGLTLANTASGSTAADDGIVFASASGGSVSSVVYGVYNQVYGFLSYTVPGLSPGIYQLTVHDSVYGQIPVSGTVQIPSAPALNWAGSAGTTPALLSGGGSGSGGSGNSAAAGLIPAQAQAADLSAAANLSLDDAGVLHVSVNSSSAIADLAAATPGTQYFVLTVPAQNSTSSPASSVSVVLGADMVQQAVLKGGSSAAFVVETPFGNYKLPLNALNLTAGSVLTISVGKPDTATAQSVSTAAAAKGLVTIGAPATFQVSVTDAQGHTQSIDNFGHTYMARSLPAGMINPAVTAGVRLAADGSLQPVPTWFIQNADGTYTAVMNRQGNSTYTLVSGSKTFSDIQGYWAQADIEKMAAHLLVNGETATAFAPDHSITRAEFAALLVRGLGLSDPTGSGSFTDVSTGDWFAKDVQTAASVSLIKGYEDGSFRPNQPVTREEMALMITRAMAFAGQMAPGAGSLAAFPDSVQADSWALSALAASIQAGILKGDDQGHLRPTATATRAEAAVMLERMLQNLQFLN